MLLDEWIIRRLTCSRSALVQELPPAGGEQVEPADIRQFEDDAFFFHITEGNAATQQGDLALVFQAFGVGGIEERVADAAPHQECHPLGDKANRLDAVKPHLGKDDYEGDEKDDACDAESAFSAGIGGFVAWVFIGVVIHMNKQPSLFLVEIGALMSIILDNIPKYAIHLLRIEPGIYDQNLGPPLPRIRGFFFTARKLYLGDLL